MRPKVLIACEYSGVERDAFTQVGCDAISCDLLPTEAPGPHYEGDVFDLMDREWDLVVAHPPCTYLSNSGARWLYSDPLRWQAMIDGGAFFREMFRFRTKHLCVENPVQHGWAVKVHGAGRPDQTVQPWQFGHPETKRTCYWLRGLPPLGPTLNVKDAMDALPKREANRIHYASPGADRWKMRSTSYRGIAQAMADQWTPMLLADSVELSNMAALSPQREPRRMNERD